MKIEHTSPKPRPGKGVYSRRLQRGAIGDMYDGRSTEGRFIRQLEAELIAHVGGNPSVTQRLLIERCIAIRVQLGLFDEKLRAGAWTSHDARTFGGLHSALRLALRELGSKPAPAKQPTLDDIVRQAQRGRAAA